MAKRGRVGKGGDALCKAIAPPSNGCAAEVQGGWHTFGLGVIADPNVSMTRIGARDIVVLAFKGTGS
jgi:hypothetical protein